MVFVGGTVFVVLNKDHLELVVVVAEKGLVLEVVEQLVKRKESSEGDWLLLPV